MFNKKHSIISKILMWSFLMLLSIGIFLIYYIYLINSNLVTKIGNTEANNISIKNKLKIEEKLNQAYSTGKYINSLVMTLKDDNSIGEKREIAENIIIDLLKGNQDIIGIGLAFEPNSFDNEDFKYFYSKKYGSTGKFIPYISYIDNEVTIFPQEKIEESENYFYSKSIKKATITEPYNIQIKGTTFTVTSIVIPIVYKSEFLGMLSVDIPLKNLSRDLKELLVEHNINWESRIVSYFGEVVADSADNKEVGKHISISNANYVEDINTVNKIGLTVQRDKEIYKTITDIVIGDIERKWYLFNEIELAPLIQESVSRTVRITIYLVIVIILALLFLWLIIRKVISPILSLVNEMKAFDINHIDNGLSIKESKVYEMDILVKAYQNILSNLKNTMMLRDKKDWLQQGQVKISDLVQVNNNLINLCNDVITFITKHVYGQVGALFLLNNSGDEPYYEMVSTYAYRTRKGLPETFRLGEGAVGQAALEKNMIILTDVPEDYFSIRSGLGNVKPHSIIIVPCEFNNEVVVILEIGLLGEVGEDVLEYLNLSRAAIAIAITNILNFKNVEELLERTKKQAMELKKQQNELQLSNKDLENQTKMLKISKAELESQREELRVINEELEENSNQLAEQKKKLEIKNAQLRVAQKEIERKAKDLELSNKYKSEFLANMSHELRTPLNSILLLSELLKENKDNILRDKEVEFVNTIFGAGKTLLELINDILDLSKVEAGKAIVNLEKMNIGNMVNELKSLFEQMALKKNITFEVNTVDDLPKEITTDIKKTQQIIKNLLSNAFKFTETGSIKLNISKDDYNIVYQVVDSGIGISKDHLKNIFEAFQQEDGTTSRKYGGTGLGLSISREYAKLLGGSLTVESEKGKGSSFTLELPMIYKSKKLEEKSDAYKKSKELIDNLNELDSDLVFFNEPEKIEFVQDDRDFIEEDDNVIFLISENDELDMEIKDIANKHNFKTVITNNFNNGLFLADYYTPSIILVGEKIEDKTGYHFIDKLKTNKRLEKVPKILIGDGTSFIKHENYFYIEENATGDEIEDLIIDLEISDESRVACIGEKIDILDELKELMDIEIEDYSHEYENLIDEIKKSKHDILFINLVDLDMDIDFINKIRMADMEHLKIVYISKEIKDRELMDEKNRFSDLLEEVKILIHNYINKSEENSIDYSVENEAFFEKNVLVVDDDMRNTFALSNILEGNGMLLTIANDGKKALEILNDNKNIDIIIMDIMMPEMDGYEAIGEIRKIKDYENIPIIALTAKAIKGDRKKCIDAGANDYLSKPVEKNKLLSLLRVWLID